MELIVKVCGIHSRTPSFAQGQVTAPCVTRLAFSPTTVRRCERFVSAKHLVWLNPPLLIETAPRRRRRRRQTETFRSPALQAHSAAHGLMERGAFSVVLIEMWPKTETICSVTPFWSRSIENPSDGANGRQELRGDNVHQFQALMLSVNEESAHSIVVKAA